MVRRLSRRREYHSTGRKKSRLKWKNLALLLSTHHNNNKASFPPLLHLLTPIQFPFESSLICFHLHSPRWKISVSLVQLIDRRVLPDRPAQALAFPECTIWMQNSSWIAHWRISSLQNTWDEQSIRVSLLFQFIFHLDELARTLPRIFTCQLLMYT